MSGKDSGLILGFCFSLHEQGLGATPNRSLSPGRDGDLCQSTAVTPAGQFKEKRGGALKGVPPSPAQRLVVLAGGLGEKM